MNASIYRLKKDKYTKKRGGTSKIISLFCNNCGYELLLYQKDGPGNLFRLYLDKILAPDKFSNLSNSTLSKRSLDTLICPKCKIIIGFPMLYKKEGRIAYKLNKGHSHIKENKKGIFPSC